MNKRDRAELEKAIKAHPANGPRKTKFYSITTYNCCEHCGLNFLEDSECNAYPDSHASPCNEKGCIKGREIANS